MRAGRSQTGLDSRAQSGAVLVFVVLLMLGLIGLGHGVLVSSLGEASASRTMVSHLVSRAAADGAVHVALRQPGGAWMDSVPVGGARSGGVLSLGRARAVWSLRRLAAESWLVEGEGALPGRTPVRAARLAWALDPLERVSALPGAIVVSSGAPVTLLGSVDASRPADVVSPLTDEDCAPWMSDLEARYGSAPLAAVSTLSDTTPTPGLGLLDFQAVLDAADVLVEGAGTPTPVEHFGACAPYEPWGWGDPHRPLRPCGAHLPLRTSLGDLSVIGGAGQGMLVVDGDVTLTAGARYYGFVLVRGALHIDDGAAVEGLAVALGGINVGPLGRFTASACWAARAIAAQRGTLGRLIAVPGVGRLDPL